MEQLVLFEEPHKVNICRFVEVNCWLTVEVPGNLDDEEAEYQARDTVYSLTSTLDPEIERVQVLPRV